MNNVIDSPVGIDSVIKKVQTSLYTFLTARWSGAIEGFGKAYKNEYKDNFKLEWYSDTKKDYEDVYYDDNFAAMFFFIEGEDDDSEDEIVFVSEVKCVFMVDLSLILPDTGRSDAQAHRDAVEGLRSVSREFQVIGLEKGMSEVFSGIDTEKIKFNNIHPLHCFAVRMRLNYYLTDKCT